MLLINTEFGLILRLPEEKEPAIRYALYIPSRGKRRTGRLRTSYLAYSQHKLGYDENEMTVEEIVTLAKNRCAWRKLSSFSSMQLQSNVVNVVSEKSHRKK